MSTERQNISLWKAHGLGNDYLVWESSVGVLNAERVKTICHRHTGVGSDGILEPHATSRADYGLKIWNPDGSVAEKSGNGLRIYAWWLYKHKNASRSFTMDTGNSVVKAWILGPELVKIDMGPPTFDSKMIPAVQELWGVPYLEWNIYAVGMGNPLCVVLFEHEDLDELPWRSWGSQLELDERFPSRTNVQFVRRLSSSRFELRIWERGAGETSASGSSSCAAFAVLRRLGLIEDEAVAQMPGGELNLSFEHGTIFLSGSVCEVGRMQLSFGMTEKIMSI